MARSWRNILFFVALVALGLVGVYVTSNVSTTLTEEDRTYADRILRETGHGGLVGKAAPRDFDDQVKTILAVQDAVLTTAPENTAIPFDRPRELADLYKARSGQCFDRSRAMERILNHLGLTTRYAAVYSTKDTGSRVTSLLTKGTPSHAVIEAKTERGWIVVDSNRRWIGLTSDGDPIDLKKLQSMDAAAETWDPRAEKQAARILREPFTYVIGLYSRHGRFYPPYWPVPDIGWRQVPANFSG